MTFEYWVILTLVLLIAALICFATYQTRVIDRIVGNRVRILTDEDFKKLTDRKQPFKDPMLQITSTKSAEVTDADQV